MKLIRPLAAIVFFVAAGSLNSFGSSVLCQSLPTSVTVGQFFNTLYLCTVPANAVATGKSLRLTANLHAVNSGTHGVVSNVEVNGELIAGTSTTAQSADQNWNLMITNIGGTSFSIGGTSTTGQSTLAWGTATVNRPSMPWSSGFSLQIWVAFGTGTYTVDGDTFLVEIID